MNEECLLQYLTGNTNTQSFVLECGYTNEKFDFAEYNEVAWFFV